MDRSFHSSKMSGGRYSQKSKVWPQYNEAPGISPSPRVEIVTVRFQPELNAERLWVLPPILTANSASFVMIRFVENGCRIRDPKGFTDVGTDTWTAVLFCSALCEIYPQTAARHRASLVLGVMIFRRKFPKRVEFKKLDRGGGRVLSVLCQRFPLPTGKCVVYFLSW